MPLAAPAPTPAAAPAAAAPAPPSPATKAPSAPPSPAPSHDDRSSNAGVPDDFASEIDAAIAAEEAKEAKRNAPRKPTKKPDAKSDAKDDSNADIDAAAAVTKPDAQAQPAGEKEPATVPEVRKAYETLKKRVKEDFEPKIQQLQALQARVKELETTAPPEVKTLQERLASAEKRRDELEQEIHFVDYSKSKEFVEKYQQPYVEAWADARKDLAELSVENPDGTVRPATDEDMINIARLPLGEARKLANELFGDSADDVMAHRRRIIDLAAAQSKALATAKTSAAERAKLKETEMRTSSERNTKVWNEANTALVAKYPKTFGKVEDDPEGNALLEKGFSLADRIFAQTPENTPKTPEEAAHIGALIRHKIANHDRQVLWLKKATAKIKDLETRLAEYEKSDPNGGLDGTGPDASEGKSFLDEVNAEIDAAARKSGR